MYAAPKYENAHPKGLFARKIHYVSSIAPMYVKVGVMLFAKNVAPNGLSTKIFTKVHKKSHFPEDGPVGPLDIKESVGSSQLEAIKGWIRTEAEHGGLIKPGDPAPMAIPLFILGPDNQMAPKSLGDLMVSGRPLVVNLGSCS